jgi:hypothetical protein
MAQELNTPVVSGFVMLYGNGRREKKSFKEEERDGDRT